MNQSTLPYDIPQTEERIDQSISGTLTAILGYSFDHVFESAPGSNRERSETITTFQIQAPGDFGKKYNLEFRGFIGAELVGPVVMSELKTADFSLR